MTIKEKVILIRNLLYFLDIVITGSFSKTAEKNGIKVSNLSLLIRELEEELGVCLLQRMSTGVVPTSEGLYIYNLVLGIKEELIDIGNLKNKFQEKTEVILYIPDQIIFQNIRDFKNTYPFIDLKITHIPRNFDVGLFLYSPKIKTNFMIEQYSIAIKNFSQTLWISFNIQVKQAYLVKEFILSQLIS